MRMDPTTIPRLGPSYWEGGRLDNPGLTVHIAVEASLMQRPQAPLVLACTTHPPDREGLGRSSFYQMAPRIGIPSAVLQSQHSSLALAMVSLPPCESWITCPTVRYLGLRSIPRPVSGSTQE